MNNIIEKEALPETLFIYNKLLSNEQINKVQSFLEEIQINKDMYDLSGLWLFDQSIGGIGGYCMPPNPCFNPFPGGTNRELFRPLQYARSEIDICDIRMNARHIVLYSGMHLEAVLRLFLTELSPLGKLRYFNTTLGKASKEISKTNIFDEVLINSLFKFVALYNKAKHEVNMFEDRPRMFSPADAIICYLSARIIGQTILLYLHYPLSLITYDINNEECAFN